MCIRDRFIYGDYYAQSGKYAEWLEMNKKWLSTAGFHTAHHVSYTHLIYSYLLLGAMFLLGGCSDLLDIDPKNKIPADELFSTPEGVQAHMALSLIHI